MTKHQRIANAVWLREQIAQLAKDAESNAKEDASNAKEDSPSERDTHEARAATARHYATELRRILRGLTWEEDFAMRASAAWTQADRKVVAARTKAKAR